MYRPVALTPILMKCFERLVMQHIKSKMARSSSACAEFNSKNVVLPTSSRNSRLYARLKTGRRDEYVQKLCDLQDKKHENTILSGEREAAASVVRAAILDFSSFQSGFRKWRNTMDSILCLESEIRKAKVNKEVLVGVFFDVEKAYDRYDVERGTFN